MGPDLAAAITAALADAPALAGGLAASLLASPYLCIPLCAAGAVLGICALRVPGKAVIRAARVNRLAARYPTALAFLSKDFRIERARRRRPNAYSLAFPHWRHATASGAQDRRRRDNEVVWERCTLHLDGYLIWCTHPGPMVDLVAGLRDAGASIEPCPLEVEKGTRLLQTARDLHALDSISALYERFAACPVQFEHYCAGLLRRTGHGRAVPTPATNDGGYDIALYAPHEDSLVGIVECKCFAPGNKVGRPLVQKLVGASQTVGAPRMLFITTSSFSHEALAYARQSGVDCIDGEGLLGLRATAADGGSARPLGFDEVDWQLTREDIRPFYPPDFR